MSLRGLGEILRRAREQHPAFEKRLEEADAISRWPDAVGALIAKHARAVLVKNGVLWVECDHPVWRSELHLRRSQILKRLNQPGKDVIKELFFCDPK